MNFQQITAFLLENGWTQVEIGKEIGLSQPTVFAILHKGHLNIRASAADRLRKAYRKTARAVKKAA